MNKGLVKVTDIIDPDLNQTARNIIENKPQHNHKGVKYHNIIDNTSKI